MPQYNMHTFKIPWTQNEILGITPSKNLTIINIQKNTLADGIFKIGDKICNINGKNILRLYELENLLNEFNDVLYITVERNEEQENILKKQLSFIGEDDCNIVKREGFDYFVERMYTKYQRKFRLKDFKNRVIISKIKMNNDGMGNIEIGDQICSVNNMPVTDKKVCKRLLNHFLMDESEVSLIIGRPISDSAIEEINGILRKKKYYPTSIKMNDDVKEIVKRECKRIHQNDIKDITGILSNGLGGEYQSVSFDTTIQEFKIACDTEGRRLKKVKKKFY
ncbi:PDZ domain-containing protein [Strongyloides ratti]|uniref:PDZ domain-containing protein n=1 Tax=Strongyloides ratti TaxID=34506 RepID=A0A090L1I8_STRRB|nr:PDZ domain-containing protein [Strongyloides ratti]CEF63646.1 PDZ domain-containing protein [Strongyloides ratti]